MPPTICDTGKTRPALECRRAAERRHRRQQEAYFRSPFVIWDTPADSYGKESGFKGCFEWEKTYRLVGTIEKAREDLLPGDIRRFCFKDCALYIKGSSADPIYRSLLFDHIYQRWYTSRSEDVDISHGSFFCQLMCFQKRDSNNPAALTIREVVAFHHDMLSILDRLLPQLDSTPAEYAGDRRIPDDIALLLPPTQYALRPSFRHCFIYVDPSELDDKYDWATQNVTKHSAYVIFPRGRDAEPYASAEAAEGAERLHEVDTESEQAAVFLCNSIDQAMRFVLALDCKRLVGQQELHGYYQIAATEEHVTLKPWPNDLALQLR